MDDFNKSLFKKAVINLCRFGANEDARVSLVVDEYVELSQNIKRKNLLYKQMASYLTKNLFLSTFREEFNDIKQDSQRLMQNVDFNSNSLIALDNIIDSCNDLKQLIDNNIFDDQIMTRESKPISFDELLQAIEDPYKV